MSATQTEKIKIVKVEIPWGEGSSFKPQTFDSLVKADRFLKDRATEAPGHGQLGGYLKTDFVLHFADGQTYKGTYALRHRDTLHVNLIGRHVHNFVMFYSGQVKTEDLPSHLDAENYQRVVREAGVAEDSKEFLAKYELR